MLLKCFFSLTMKLES